MQDAEDAKIVRSLTKVVAAAILCLLSGGICGVIVVRDEYRSGAGQQQVELSPTSTPRR
jgi:hypothetical protein